MRLYPKLPACRKAKLFHKRDDSLLMVADEVGDFLYGLVRLTKPDVCIETGTHYGDSAIQIGKALKANGRGHLSTCETSTECVAIAQARITVNLPVSILVGTGVELIRQIQKPIDFAFIDSGDSNVRLEELHLLNETTVSPLGIVAWHDACVGYDQLYDVFQARGWPHLIFPSIVGIAVFQRPE
jgi:predicted O-methyltransferase YrrM